MEVVTTCPLKSKCEEVKRNKLYRCAWYVSVAGVDAQGKDTNESKCSMSWMPIMQLEVATTNRQTAASVQSFRNTNDTNQKAAINALNEHTKEIGNA